MVADIAAAELDVVHERIAGRFARAEPRARVREYLSGLVAGLERKNGWTLAERAGEVSPDGMQRLLRHADPHHLVHARPGLARRQQGPGRKGEPAPATRA